MLPLRLRLERICCKTTFEDGVPAGALAQVSVDGLVVLVPDAEDDAELQRGDEDRHERGQSRAVQPHHEIELIHVVDGRHGGPLRRRSFDIRLSRQMKASYLPSAAPLYCSLLTPALATLPPYASLLG